MYWPIRFAGLTQCNSLSSANLLGHYFDRYKCTYIFVVNSPIYKRRYHLYPVTDISHVKLSDNTIETGLF